MCIMTTHGATRETIATEDSRWLQWLKQYFTESEMGYFTSDDWKTLAQAGRGLLTINELAEIFGKPEMLAK